MQTLKCRYIFSAMTLFFFLLATSVCAWGQWGPPGGQQPQQPQYPYSQPPQHPQQLAPPPASGQSFNDALGRFRINLPAGTVPVGATYNFSIPMEMCQISIMTITQEQMFQMQQQNFPNMLRQMGATIDTEQQMNVNGRQGRFIAATMRDQSSGMSMHSMNVFISSGGIWVQVMGPEQNIQQVSKVFNSVLAGLQF
mgnify:CR=1 FL=1